MTFWELEKLGLKGRRGRRRGQGAEKEQEERRERDYAKRRIEKKTKKIKTGERPVCVYD